MTHVDGLSGTPAARTVDHDDWVLVQQDCDLAWNAVAGSDSLPELRPVFRDDPPANWGIRDGRLLLDASGSYLRSEAAAVRVTPDVVSMAEHTACPVPRFALRLKTWLGLRYDRPAVPQEFVRLATEISTRLRKKQHREDQDRVRDILAKFTRAPDGSAEYTLIAVVPHEAAQSDPGILASTRDWLSGVTLAVPTTLGTPTAVDAYPDDQVSLAFIEDAYALNVTKVSWPSATPGPVGATGS